MAKVMIVDDDRVALEVIADTLREAGHEVRTADSGTAMMHDLLQEPTEVLVLDVNMPDMSGDRLARILLKQLDPPLPKIILFSGIEAADLRRIARKLQVTGWVKKGAPKADLLRAVQAAASFFHTQKDWVAPTDFSTPPIREIPEPLEE